MTEAQTGNATSMNAFEARLRLDLALLRALREDLKRWLASVKVNGHLGQDIILATHEAAANAIEHAELGTEVSVRAVRKAGEVVVVVENEGEWKKPRSANGMRGRGLAVMSLLMSDLDVQAASKRTVVRMRKELSEA